MRDKTWEINESQHLVRKDPLKLLRVPWVAVVGAVGRGLIRVSVRVRFGGGAGQSWALK